MSDEKKNRIGNVLAIVVLIVSCILPFGFIVGTEILFWLLIITNLLFGPICFIGHLIEVKKGVFAYDDPEESGE